MVRFFNSYILSQLGGTQITAPPLPSLTPHNDKQQHQEWRVMWLDRRQLAHRRTVRGDSLRKLKELIEARPPLNNTRVVFEIFNPEEKSLKEQIAKVRSVHFIVGVQGAALTHLVFQPEGSTGILELSPNNRSDEHSTTNIFPNLVAWLARPYRIVPSVRLPTLDDETMERVVVELHALLTELAGTAS